jgi:hypothetical protein
LKTPPPISLHFTKPQLNLSQKRGIHEEQPVSDTFTYDPDLIERDV